jgi:hypothetical protein
LDQFSDCGDLPHLWRYFALLQGMAAAYLQEILQSQGGHLKSPPQGILEQISWTCAVNSM